jgi:hypothetical protein
LLLRLWKNLADSSASVGNAVGIGASNRACCAASSVIPAAADVVWSAANP